MVFTEKECVGVYRVGKEGRVFVSSNCISEEERLRLSQIDKTEKDKEKERKRKRKRKRLLRFSSIDKMSMKPTYKRRMKVRRFNGELKDMIKLSSNDEAFRLSWKALSEIIDFIRSRKTPTPNTCRQWDEYARSFYRKMCTCFGVDYQHLEATPPQQETHPVPKGKSYMSRLAETGVGFVLRTLSWAEGKKHFEPKTHIEEPGPVQIIQPATEEMSFDEFMDTVLDRLEIRYATLILDGAFDFGLYSPGTGPDRIPYHLHLLLKEAVYIMSNTNDKKDLKMVEEKICFFMTYFHSHVPSSFRYNRRMARYNVDSYHSTREPRYMLDGYTLYPRISFLMWGWDPRARLSPQEMVEIMNIIHSRKTPSFWGMSSEEISFYCKLCSCFRIEYDYLEGAREDAVCLMNVRRN
ncbi:hypothetical protein HanXRQr2_Chr02g0055521 [Helianthus annuus]|uniref:Uncharacterized protein n=2 Tax=Helianthus annuus TaxID=4232 RepID=A0A251VEX4_HELAN|nr:hypothetical protein HanXRQr2_Chr02g0055521 [Helianthus annuus]